MLASTDLPATESNVKSLDVGEAIPAWPLPSHKRPKIAAACTDTPDVFSGKMGGKVKQKNQLPVLANRTFSALEALVPEGMQLPPSTQP